MRAEPETARQFKSSDADDLDEASNAEPKSNQAWPVQLPYDVQGQNCVDPVAYTVEEVAKLLRLRDTF